MRILRTVEICGRMFRVVEGTAEECPELEGCDGLCDSSAAMIYIAAGHAETVQIDTLFHEIAHAVIEATGLRLKIRAAQGDEPTIDLEEEIVTVSTPALRAALKSAGWREPKRIGKAPRKPRRKAPVAE